MRLLSHLTRFYTPCSTFKKHSKLNEEQIEQLIASIPVSPANRRLRSYLADSHELINTAFKQSGSKQAMLQTYLYQRNISLRAFPEDSDRLYCQESRRAK